MKFERKQAIFNLALGLFVTAMVIVFRPEPAFDYDFENFFSQDNEELGFYQKYRDTFENDNDYLLLALRHSPDIFDSAFLARAFQIQAQIDSLAGVTETISLLTIEEPIVSPFGLRFRKVLDWSGPQSLQESKDQILQDEAFNKNFLNQKADYLLIQIKNKQKISKEEGDVLYAQILEILETNRVESYHIAGKVRAQSEFVGLMQGEFSFFLGLSFLLIALVLWFLFRQWWAVVVPVVVIGLGILWTLAIQLWTGKALDLMSVMLPTILSIVGLAAMVHFMNKYHSIIQSGESKEKAIRSAFTELALPVSLTALTTSLGFLTLYFTNVPVLKYFGLYTGVGVMVMFGAVVLIGPGLFYLSPGFGMRSTATNQWEGFLRRCLGIIFRHQKGILLGFLFLTAASLFLARELKINGYILDNLPENSELLNEFTFFDREFGGSKPLEIHLEVGTKGKSIFDRDVLEQIEKIEAFSTAHMGAASLISPLSVSKYLNKAQNGGNEKAYRLPSRGQLAQMAPLLSKWDDISPVRLYDKERRQGRISGRTPDFGSYLSGIQKEEFDRFIGEEIDSNILKARLTGTSHLIDISHQSVTVQLAKGIGIGLLVVALVVGFLFRSWLLPFLVLVPNVIPLFWVAGVMALLGAELSLSTAIIFTVAFGIAVDDTIHFMAKLKSEHSGGKSWLFGIKRTYLETGKSIALSSLVLISGFGILVFSQFGVTFYVGLLISLALFFALIADLILLPVLMILYHKAKKSR